MATIQERVAELERTANNHDAMFRLMISIGERQQDTLDEIKELVKGQGELLAEVRRDSRQTQRLWVRLAQRYGWLEDDDLQEAP